MGLEKFRMKWWGWGHPDIFFDLSEKPGVLPYLQKKLGITSLVPRKSFNLYDVDLPDTNIPNSIVNEFKEAIFETNVTTSKEERILHAYGKSYKDLVRLRSMKIEKAPDMVLYPKRKNDMEAILRLAIKHRIALIPFGGGTSVVSSLEPIRGKNLFVASIDMRRMHHILEINADSMTAHVEAGIFGPELEERLNRRGFTLGHFPQSFEFSTLGGWIATRSAGQNCLRYGAIERLVTSLTVLTAKGEIVTLNVPRASCGPEWDGLFLGSEGTLGIILSARIRLSPLPQKKKYVLYLFKNFEKAKDVSRDIMRSSAHPAMVRVSDEAETEALFAMGKSKQTFVKSIIASLFKTYLKMIGYDTKRVASMMIGYEGDARSIKRKRRYLEKEILNRHSFSLGSKPGEKWLKDRFFLPYVRDEFMDNGILVDTLETVTTWENLMPLYRKVVKTIKNSLENERCKVAVYTHISHIYKSGASLYFSVLANQDPMNPVGQWKRMKEDVNEAIVKSKGAISHHHGIGIDHKSGLHWGELEREVYGCLKHSLDPEEILNPGKIV